MPTTDVLINHEHKVLLIREEGATGVFSGFAPFGKYSHGTDHDPQGWIGNHVDYHHLRDMLYQEGEWWPSDYMIMRAKPQAESVEPLVPGPLDFTVDTRRESVGSVPFQMALPNCIVMLVSHSDINNPPMRTIQATHGDDQLTRVYGYSYRNHQVDYFFGEDLVLEEALLSFTEVGGVPITPLIGRIIDLASPATLIKTGMDRKYATDYAIGLEGNDSPMLSKAVYVSDQPLGLISVAGQEVITNHRYSVGDVIPFEPTFQDGWIANGTKWVHTGDTSYLEGPIEGDQDTTHSNGFVADVTIGAESSLLIQFMSPNGASRNITIAGPYDGEMHEVFSVSGAYYAAVRVTAYNNVTIENFVVKKDMIAKSVIMSHTEVPVDDPEYRVTYKLNKSIYGDLSAISYTI